MGAWLESWIGNALGFIQYWEFTKLKYGGEMVPVIRQIIRDAFTEESYDEELEAERLLWYDTPFGI